MYLQHGTRADILARTQRLGETALRRPPPPALPAANRTGAAGTVQQGVGTSSDVDVDVVRAVQRELSHRGYEPGPAGGLVHAVTRAAVMAYEHDHGLPLTGQPSEDLLKTILFGVPAGAGNGRGQEPLPQAKEIIRSVQDSLQSLGYPVKVDGRMGEETARAIRTFETQQGLTPSGRVSGTLMLKLSETMDRRQRRVSVR